MRKLVLVALMLASLAGCRDEFKSGTGSASGDPWIRIDSPISGVTTGLERILVSGNASLSNGGYPDATIYWYNNGNSGTANYEVSCFLACIVIWSANVPLNLGENTITVTFGSSSDSIVITRYQVMSISGEVLTETTGLPVPSVKVQTLGDNYNLSLYTNPDGQFTFSNLVSGTYTLEASLPSPLNSSCFSFTPSVRTVVLTSNDAANENFTASFADPCYSLSGRVTASNNSSFGQPNVMITIQDELGNTLATYTDSSGNYVFPFLISGTYTVTPSIAYSTFFPVNTSVSVSSNDITGIDFLREF